jgi:hypothetical protein
MLRSNAYIAEHNDAALQRKPFWQAQAKRA